MLNLLLTRHGNTFDKGDTILRVGSKTDLPLSNSGKTQCITLGKQLSQEVQRIDHAFCSNLIRTKQSAELILSQFKDNTCPITSIDLLNEIDYGVDDGKPESEVVKRLGIDAIKAWDEHCVLPKGWHFDPQKAIHDITHFANDLIRQYENQTILIVTSNGIARFFTELFKAHKSIESASLLKMPTASVSKLAHSKVTGWQCHFWGKRF